MFGFIHESIRQLMLRKYGEDLWQTVLKRCGFESGKENIVNHYYNDSDTYQLVDSVSVITKMSREQVWEMYGAFLIEYTMEMGWDELVRSMSSTLKGFLDNLDSLHYFIDHVVYKANLRGPSFRCEENSDGTITLHYFTGRPGLFPIVRGVIREVARRVFKIDVGLTITGRTQKSVQMTTGERLEEHVIFQIKLCSDDPNGTFAPRSSPLISESAENFLRLSAVDFSSAMPYHFIMDEDCRLVFAGRELYNHIPRQLLTPGTPILRLFDINRPQIPIDFDNICNFINAVFVLQIKTSQSDMLEQQRRESGADSLGSDTDSNSSQQNLILKGQMLMLNSGKHIIYLCSPYVTSIPEVTQFGMKLTAMPLHDATRDIVLLNQQRLSDVELNLQLEANNEQLESLAKDLEREKEKTDSLLKDMLPQTIADALMNGEQIAAREYSDSSVMFTDIPNFIQIVAKCPPPEIVGLLNELFSKFDRLVEIHSVYKVETVGDSYMTVTGIPDVMEEHAEVICHAALGMLWEGRSCKDPVTKEPLQVRIGIHSGPIVAGVLAAKMPRYCLLGDTVSTASRIEAAGLPSRIHISAKAAELARKTGRFEFEERGGVSIRGKGEMDTFFLLRSYKKSIWEIVKRPRDLAHNSIDGYEELLGGRDISAKITEMREKVHAQLAEKNGTSPNSQACSLQ